MTAVPLDTHEVVKELKAVGFTDEQAEAVTRVVRKAQDIDLSNLATKSDIVALKSDIESFRAATKADIEAFRSTTKSDIETLRLATKSDIEALRLSTKSDIETLRSATKSDIETLRSATKSDIETLRSATKSDIQVGLAEVRNELHGMRTEILKWMISSMGVQTVVILGTVVALARLATH